MTRRPSALHGRDNFEAGVTPDRRKRCQIKIVVDKNMRSRDSWYYSLRPTPDLCIVCGTDHGYCDAFRGGR